MAIKTKCEPCLFAERDTDNVQIGCQFNRLNIAKENNVEIEEEENSFILQRLCIYCRNKDWGKTTSQENWKSQVEKEIELKYVIIIRSDQNLELLYKTLLSINKQTISSVQLFVCSSQENILNVMNMVKSFKWNKWRCRFYKPPFEWVIDEIIPDAELSSIYCVCEEGTVFPKTFFADLGQKINDFHTFDMLEGKGFYIIPTALHALMDGNFYRPLKEKILESREKS